MEASRTPTLEPVQQALKASIQPAGIQTPTAPNGFLGKEEWQSFLAKVSHECKSGSCQHALKPKCKCGCKGRGHMEAIRKSNHIMEEFANATPPSLPFGAVAA